MLTEKPLKTFEAGPSGVKLEYFFDEKLEEARNELEEARTERPELSNEVPVPSPVEAATSYDFMEEMKQLAEVAPSAVILESFSRLERVLRETFEKEPGDGRAPRRPVTARQLVHQAVTRGTLSPSEAAAFDDVAVLRNVVAHGGTTDLDAARALSYASLVRLLINSILSTQGQATNDGSAG
jgi:hypothetical protein